VVNAVEIRNIHKSFTGRKALDGVSISLAPGEMVALIGASGSGKSTLLRHIPGFVTADEGEVSVFGQSMQARGRIARDVRRARSQVGFVFQQFNLVNRLPVITNVLIGLLHRAAWWRRALMHFSVDERRQAIHALAAVGIEDTAWQRASTLSGGQQQRAALARCLVQRAKLVLADEPIASLDPEASRKVMELLAGMNRDHGCTVLVSLHQVEFAIRYCPRTIALHAGRVVFDGPSASLTPTLLAELYGSQVRELFAPSAAAVSALEGTELPRAALAAV
jgi:phosphonate transport system ATP-binding protein